MTFSYDLSNNIGKLRLEISDANELSYIYSDEGFRFLDSIVKWCSKYHVGLIWDMHGAPGAQNAENIADSDGEARLWTEKEIYWPRTIELWYKIAERYKDYDCIVGYDLLNEPLLIRYDHVQNHLLRELYIELTKTIRKIDTTGIIFIEGDDWAQTYDILEPLDWDRHLVIAFHSYPPTSNQEGLQRWDDLRNKYQIPLWHGETGEQRPPYGLNRKSTEFLESANVGWCWWTHKKFERRSQPWNCYRTDGFQKILDYWKGEQEKSTKEEAKEWLFDQAYKTHMKYCEFLPDMVESLYPLNTANYLNSLTPQEPLIIRQPKNISVTEGEVPLFDIAASGNLINYQWYMNNKKIEEENKSELTLPNVNIDDNESIIYVVLSNSKGKLKSNEVILNVDPFQGPYAIYFDNPPTIDGVIDESWTKMEEIQVLNKVYGRKYEVNDLSSFFKIAYDNDNLYILVHVSDDVMKIDNKVSYHNDGIEIYIDPDNNKPKYYSENEYMIRVLRGDRKNDYNINRGKLKGDIFVAGSENNNNYIVEASIPWTSVGEKPARGQFIGIDIQINDNDSDRRENKIAWNAKQDNALNRPIVFGVIKIK